MKPPFLCSLMMIVAFMTTNTVAHTASAELTPTETVQETVSTLMQILVEPAYEQPGMSDERRAAIENVVRSAVSYQEMAQRSLGVTWMLLGELDRQHFSNLFVEVLRDTSASRMNGYSHAHVVYLSEQNGVRGISLKSARCFEEARTILRLISAC